MREYHEHDEPAFLLPDGKTHRQEADDSMSALAFAMCWVIGAIAALIVVAMRAMFGTG